MHRDCITSKRRKYFVYAQCSWARPTKVPAARKGVEAIALCVNVCNPKQCGMFQSMTRRWISLCDSVYAEYPYREHSIIYEMVSRLPPERHLLMRHCSLLTTVVSHATMNVLAGVLVAGRCQCTDTQVLRHMLTFPCTRPPRLH